MSTLKVTNLQHPSAAAANVTLDSSGNAAFSGGISGVTSVNGGALSNRNVVINGEMMIDQRNGGSSTTPTSNETYTLDRWCAELNDPSLYSVQQSSDAPSGFKNSMLITSLSSHSLTANDFYMMQYKVEGFDAARFDWGSSDAKDVTLSFWVKSSLTGTFGGGFENNANNRAYAFSYTINSANTWEYKTISISGDQTGTWLTTNGIGIRLRFALGIGSTYSGTGGAWGSTRLFSVTGATSVVSTSGATWQLTGVMLETGDTATSYPHEDYGTLLQKCQRYYEKSYNNDVTPGTTTPYGWSGGDRPSGTAARFRAEFKTTKRGNPTFTTYHHSTGASGVIYTSSDGTQTAAISGVGMNRVQIAIDGGSLSSNAEVGCHWTADAEL